MNNTDHSLPIDLVEQRILENQQDLSLMQKFFEQKKLEICQLQNFIFREFQNIQVWKLQKDRVADLIQNDVRDLLGTMREILGGLFGKVRNIAFGIFQEAAYSFQVKLEEQNKIIKNKVKEIQQQSCLIFHLKQEIQRKPQKSQKHYGGFCNLKQISKEVSRIRLIQHQKSLTKLAINSRNFTSKSQQKSARVQNTDISMGHSRIELKKYQLQEERKRVLKGLKNGEQQNKQLPQKKPKLYSEVIREHRYAPEHTKDHKRYVKQKIECLKNKNSIIFHK